VYRPVVRASPPTPPHPPTAPAAAPPTDDGAAIRAHYLRRWTTWNHVRASRTAAARSAVGLWGVIGKSGAPALQVI